MRRFDPPDPAQCPDHPHHARPGRYLRLVFLQTFYVRPAVQLRPGRVGPLLPLVSRADGTLAIGSAGRRHARRCVRGRGRQPGRASPAADRLLRSALGRSLPELPRNDRPIAPPATFRFAGRSTAARSSVGVDTRSILVSLLTELERPRPRLAGRQSAGGRNRCRRVRSHRTFGRLGRARDCARPSCRSRASLSADHRAVPDIAEACNNLGNVLKDQGRLDDAAAQYQQAATEAPARCGPHQLGQHLQRTGPARPGHRLLQKVPGHRGPQSARGPQQPRPVLKEQRRLDKAERHLLAALDLKPDYAEAHSNLGGVPKNRAGTTRRSPVSKRRCRSIPTLPKPTVVWATYWRGLGRLTRRRPSTSGRWLLQPNCPEAHHDRATIKTFHPGDPELAALEAIVADPSRLPERTWPPSISRSASAGRRRPVRSCLRATTAGERPEAARSRL